MLAARRGGLRGPGGRSDDLSRGEARRVRLPAAYFAPTRRASRWWPGLAVAGALVGALWAWLAPPIHGVVALTQSGERVHDYLGNEADHFFVAAFLMLGLLTVRRGGGGRAGSGSGAPHRGSGDGGRAVRSAWRRPPVPRPASARSWCGCATARSISTRSPVTPEHRGALRHRGAVGVLRALAATDRRDAAAVRPRPRRWSTPAGGGDAARRSRRAIRPSGGRCAPVKVRGPTPSQRTAAVPSGR